jgi:hypothetical protein
MPPDKGVVYDNFASYFFCPKKPVAGCGAEDEPKVNFLNKTICTYL